jgi:hypothetical protein
MNREVQAPRTLTYNQLFFAIMWESNRDLRGGFFGKIPSHL